jgi:serine O-acetyltransferase
MFSRIAHDVRCVFERDPAARSWFEVLTCYPGLHALWLHRVAHRLWRWRMHWPARFLSGLGRWFTGIEIHPGATIGQGVFIDHGMGVVIGETAQVGDNCTIYQGVTLGGTSLTKGAKRHPTLGNAVVVGAGAKVLGGFTVGEGARIGSNSVVVKAVPAHATAVGNPARVIQGDSHAQREAAASRMGFSAYGVTSSDDPISQAMRGLIDNAATQDHQIAMLWQALQQLQRGEPVTLPKDAATHERFESENLNRMMGQ